ncbi:hypothetical protein ACHMW6_14475 [Pseudoduganella sp. UC29_106]|uniref:hypothetical protein n=1 Tax=Pseudoduganella sp. UC29_106 TaxID=3374553 RepID=UPI003756BBEA
MPPEFAIEDRRTLDGLASVVDNALSLADNWGWSYALAYLISERVPPRVIQRLLSGTARAKGSRRKDLMPAQAKTYGWKGTHSDEMKRLFESLGNRRANDTKQSNPTQTSVRNAGTDESN